MLISSLSNMDTSTTLGSELLILHHLVFAEAQPGNV